MAPWSPSSLAPPLPLAHVEVEVDAEEEAGSTFCVTSSTERGTSVFKGINLTFKLSTYRDEFVLLPTVFEVVLLLQSGCEVPAELELKFVDIEYFL